ncbi:hypothetical protein DID75_01700 [Candidatus Marinamargulisbacteria bacterium SCGC AG-410-N11]|nr:hypothetical protein DID75_01700 [Candidatus Marinamargulisbacteria bacterium SCGC AG-410-N11]
MTLPLNKIIAFQNEIAIQVPKEKLLLSRYLSDPDSQFDNYSIQLIKNYLSSPKTYLIQQKKCSYINNSTHPEKATLTTINKTFPIGLLNELLTHIYSVNITHLKKDRLTVLHLLLKKIISECKTIDSVLNPKQILIITNSCIVHELLQVINKKKPLKTTLNLEYLSPKDLLKIYQTFPKLITKIHSKYKYKTNSNLKSILKQAWNSKIQKEKNSQLFNKKLLQKLTTVQHQNKQLELKLSQKHNKTEQQLNQLKLKLAALKTIKSKKIKEQQQKIKEQANKSIQKLKETISKEKTIYQQLCLDLKTVQANHNKKNLLSKKITQLIQQLKNEKNKYINYESTLKKEFQTKKNNLESKIKALTQQLNKLRSQNFDNQIINVNKKNTVLRKKVKTINNRLNKVNDMIESLKKIHSAYDYSKKIEIKNKTTLKKDIQYFQQSNKQLKQELKQYETVNNSLLENSKNLTTSNSNISNLLQLRQSLFLQYQLIFLLNNSITTQDGINFTKINDLFPLIKTIINQNIDICIKEKVLYICGHKFKKMNSHINFGNIDFDLNKSRDNSKYDL